MVVRKKVRDLKRGDVVNAIVGKYTVWCVEKAPFIHDEAFEVFETGSRSLGIYSGGDVAEVEA